MSTTTAKHPYREIFSTLKHLPFLFIGSGISRRYMNLPNWEELLRYFASKVHPGNPLALEVFSSKAPDRNWPVVSSLIEAEFNAIWLTSPEYEKQRITHQETVKAGASPFKLELAAFFRKAKKYVVFDNGKFDLKSLVENALVKLQKSHSHSLPIHKYVSAYRTQFGMEPPPKLLEDCKDSLEGLLNTCLKKQRADHPIESFDELTQLAPSKEKWFELFPRLRNPEVYLQELKKFLQEYLTECVTAFREGKSNDKTNLKRVIRIYDWLKYGHAKDAHDSEAESEPQRDHRSTVRQGVS